MMSSFMSKEELLEMGFKSFGENVLISKKASIYGASNMEIGNHVRIDDFCFLSGKIKIGNYVHVATASMLYGGPAGIELGDFTGVSQRCTLIADSDDYSGESLTNPMTANEYKTPVQEKIVMEKHSILGASCTVLPGVVVGEGTAVGSMSLINKSLDGWGIYFGVPAKRAGDRSHKIEEHEKSFLNKYGK